VRDDDYFKGMSRKTFDIEGQPIEFPLFYKVEIPDVGKFAEIKPGEHLI